MEINDINKLLQTIFAPWIVDLGVTCTSAEKTRSRFVLPANDRLVHVGGVICGQATASVADTAAVVALAAANGRFRICATVDLTTHFIRPLPPGDVDVVIDVLSNGKKMAFTRAELFAPGTQNPAVSATMAFVYMED